jgi:sugar phosphate isomerase/epimerase
VLANIKTLGCSYAVVAYVAEDLRRTLEQVQQLASLFNSYGAICRDAGVQFAYHNHNFEFEPLDGSTIFDMLVESTDPALVAFELDVYWARYAGEDPVATIKRLARRVPLLHAKDMAEDEMSRVIDAPVGDGILPWPEILTASEQAGVEYYVIEQDHPRNPLSDTFKSLKCLRQLLNE